MDKKGIIFYVLLIGLFCQCKTSQEIQFKDGKCYAKCVVPYIPEGDYDEYAVYTGDHLEEDVELEDMEIVLQEKTTKWVKKKADRNCLSADPKDCYVWCLVDIPEKIERFTVLIDTTQSNQFELKRIYKNANPDKSASIEWKEVVCENDVTESLVVKIQNSLNENQYYNEAINGNFDAITKNALISFQIDNKLPQGQLDFETLDALGVVVEK